jgi:hypothetical protein
MRMVFSSAFVRTARAVLMAALLGGCGNASPGSRPAISTHDGAADGGDAVVDAVDTVDTLGSGTEVDAPGDQPGRLRQLYVYAGDQRLSAGGIYDSQLNMFCGIESTLDGTLRCQPGVPYDIRFLDPQCNVPVSLAPPGPGSPYLAVVVFVPCGRFTMETYHHGAAPQVVTTLYNRGDSGLSNDCTGGPAPPTAVYPLERATDLMAAVTIEKGVAREGISEMHFASDGRALGPAGWFDEKLSEPCDVFMTDAQTAVVAVDGMIRCLPTEYLNAVGGFFSDVDCQHPVAAISSASRDTCSITAAGSDFLDSATCPVAARAYRLTGPESGPFHSADLSGACKTTSRGIRWDTATEIAPDPLPPARLELAPAGQRLRSQRVVTAAGAVTRVYSWDENLGTYCVPKFATDGKLRCLPSLLETPVTQRFADPKCQTPLASVLVGGCGDWTAVTSSGNHAFRLGARHDGVAFTMVAGTCTQESQPFGRRFVRGDEISAADLVELRVGE